jgi:hypothetical protein
MQSTDCSIDAVTSQHGIKLFEAIDQHSQSTRCLSKAASWYNECCSNHAYCSYIDESKTILPKRVLDLGPADGSRQPRVVHSNGRRGIWAALSYCWGSSSPLVLNQATAIQLAAGLPLQQFPVTIRDAIIITRAVGLRYLWVDSLCIFQDSAEDWGEESSKMHRVYRDASLTIMAAWGDSVNDGVFSRREPDLPDLPITWTASPPGHSEVQEFSSLLRPRLGLGMAKSMPLWSRGWALQEEILSRRILEYTVHHMIWTCLECCVDEGARTAGTVSGGFKNYVHQSGQRESSTPHSGNHRRFRSLVRSILRRRNTTPNLSSISTPGLDSLDEVKFHDLWDDLVCSYTLRLLTRNSDVLPALSGLASAFALTSKFQYYAGLWEKSLLRGLLWHREVLTPNHVNAEDSFISAKLVLKKAGVYYAPSWSWASILGGMVKWHIDHREFEASLYHAKSRANILSVQMETKGGSPHAGVTSGSITLEAPLYPLTEFCSGLEPANSTADANLLQPLQMLVDAFISTAKHAAAEYAQQHVPHPGQRFGALCIVEWADSPIKVESQRARPEPPKGMELLLVESTGTGDSEFRRVGCLSTSRLCNGFGLSTQANFTENAAERLHEFSVGERIEELTVDKELPSRKVRQKLGDLSEAAVSSLRNLHVKDERYVIV